MRTKQSGFTLFELLVSISIIAILVAIASVSFSAAQKKARDARRQDDMRAIQTAAEQYYSLSDYSYPPSEGPFIAGTGTTLLEVWPTDPKTKTDYDCLTIGVNGYCCCADLENQTGNSQDNNCTFSNVGGTGPNFCVKNQQ